MKKAAKYGVIIGMTVGCVAIGTGIGIGVGLKLQKDKPITKEEQVVSSKLVEEKITEESETTISDSVEADHVEAVHSNGLDAYADHLIYAADLEAKRDAWEREDQRVMEESSQEAERDKEEYMNDPEYYLLPNSNTDKIMTYEYSYFSKAQCDLARNEIYARHGYIFKKDDYKKVFGAKSWYIPTISDIDQIKLSEAEIFNVNCLKWWSEIEHDTSYRLSDIGYTDCYQFALVEHINLDLNGDGIMEEIIFKRDKLDEDPGDVWIEVNGEKSEPISGFFDPHIWVVDVDKEDPYLEMVIYDWGPSGDPVDYYYTYDGKNIVEMGAVSGHLNEEDYIKDTVLHAVRRSDILGTKYYRENYTLADDHTWKLVPYEMVDVNVPLIAMKDILIYRSKDRHSETKVCKMGTAMTATQTDLEKWVKVKLEDGSEGWVESITMYDIGGLLYCD